MLGTFFLSIFITQEVIRRNIIVLVDNVSKPINLIHGYQKFEAQTARFLVSIYTLTDTHTHTRTQPHSHTLKYIYILTISFKSIYRLKKNNTKVINVQLYIYIYICSRCSRYISNPIVRVIFIIDVFCISYFEFLHFFLLYLLSVLLMNMCPFENKYSQYIYIYIYIYILTVSFKSSPECSTPGRGAYLLSSTPSVSLYYNSSASLDT